MSIRDGVRESRTTEIERVKPSDGQRKRKGDREWRWDMDGLECEHINREVEC